LDEIYTIDDVSESVIPLALLLIVPLRLHSYLIPLRLHSYLVPLRPPE
jgi:hypothetical protein